MGIFGVCCALVFKEFLSAIILPEDIRNSCSALVISILLLCLCVHVPSPSVSQTSQLPAVQLFRYIICIYKLVVLYLLLPP